MLMPGPRHLTYQVQNRHWNSQRFWPDLSIVATGSQKCCMLMFPGPWQAAFGLSLALTSLSALSPSDSESPESIFVQSLFWALCWRSDVLSTCRRGWDLLVHFLFLSRF